MPRHQTKPDPRGAYQRGRILAAIEKEALTAQELADRLHLTRDGINIHLKAMKAMTPRLVHVSGWVYNPKGGRPAPQYRPGDTTDAKYVAVRAPTRHLQTGEHKSRIMRLLEQKKRTILQLSDELGLSHQWTRHLISELRAEGRVRIGDWQRQAAGIAPLYVIGSKANKPKPTHTKTAWQRRMERIGANPDAREVYERMLKRRQIKERIERMKPVTWFGALPGAQSVIQHKEAA
jgi:predicted ArsR family transcriptional regulator